MNKLLLKMMGTTLLSSLIWGCKVDFVSGSEAMKNTYRPAEKKTVYIREEDGSKIPVTISNPRVRDDELLYASSNLHKISKVALVNVFVNDSPHRLDKKGKMELFSNVTSILSGDPVEKTKISFADSLTKLMYDQAVTSFNQKFGWNFLPESEILKSEYINTNPVIAPLEEQKLKQDISDARTAMLPRTAKMEAIKKAENAYEKRVKGVEVESAASYPGSVAFTGINLDNSSYSHEVLGEMAKELDVDATMVIFLHIREKKSSNPFSADSEYGLSMNFMLVDQNGEVISTAKRFDSHSRVYWNVDNSSEVNLASEEKSLPIFQQAYSKVLSYHLESLANWKADYEQAFAQINGTQTEQTGSNEQTSM